MKTYFADYAVGKTGEFYLVKDVEPIIEANREMLEALEELLECVLEPTHPLALAVAISRANRVITKAKGEQQ